MLPLDGELLHGAKSLNSHNQLAGHRRGGKHVETQLARLHLHRAEAHEAERHQDDEQEGREDITLPTGLAGPRVRPILHRVMTPLAVVAGQTLPAAGTQAQHACGTLVPVAAAQD